MEDYRQRIGRRIEQLRTDNNISQQQLAERSGVTQNNISRIEQGKYDPRADTLEKIAHAMNMQLDFKEKPTE